MGTDKWQERPDISWWVVGFVDGEGTFSVSLFRNRTANLGWQVFPEFVVTQGEKSLPSLRVVKDFFGCGKIYVNRRYDNHKENIYRYCVRSRKDLQGKIVPFFESYPLKTEKSSDFAKFSKVLNLLDQGRHLSKEGLKEIAVIIETMNRRKKSAYLESPEAIRQDPK